MEEPSGTCTARPLIVREICLVAAAYASPAAASGALAAAGAAALLIRPLRQRGRARDRLLRCPRPLQHAAATASRGSPAASTGGSPADSMIAPREGLTVRRGSEIAEKQRVAHLPA